MLSRLKFEFDPAIKKMLGNVPNDFWEDKTKTFFDPAMGGGQFLAVIQDILRHKYHHTDEEIASRLHGVSDHKRNLNYAIHKHNLLGTYWVTDFLKKEFNMKFDVIVGNPPFKNGNESGGSSSLWRSISKTSWDLVNDDGFHCMIAPHLPNSAKDLGFIFHQYQTLFVWTKIKKHFPNVGSSFIAWLVQKTPKNQKTFFVDENIFIDLTSERLPKNIKSIPILNKINHNQELFECLSSVEYFHTSVADGKNDDFLNTIKTKTLKYKLRRTSGKTFEMYGAVLPTDYYQPKVTFTFSGYPHFKYHSSSDPIGTINYMSGHILVNDELEGNNLIKIFNSKIYKFIQSELNTKGMTGKLFFSLPKVDLTRSWTDQELYEHFNLTQEEIEYIESSVK